MIPELGQFSLILSLCFSLLLMFVPLVGTYIHDDTLMRMAKPLALSAAFFVNIGFFLLAYSFLQDDFSVKIVSLHSNLDLPTIYKLTALWGNHEGSLLLWVEILVLWLAAVALLSRDLPIDMRARVLAVMGAITVGFLLFMLLTSNPFERTFPYVPIDGKDLNPLLQDFGMAIHPPMLYFGYVGFSVAFAFAIAGLLSGEFDAAWLRWTRPWTLAAWAFLTVGIALGSWWAYYELGWGGWWFWDPVENASFMPWLVGTALLHSLAVTEQRGLFQSWTILLAIFAFSLSLLGTFLVRSGVLTSVHSFAADPERGLFILGFLGIVVGGSLCLFAVRAPTASAQGSFTFFSKEMFLLLNNVVLVVASLSVLAGTLFPLLADFLELGKYSAGPPFFNAFFVPLMTGLIVLVGVGPLLRWKQTRQAQLKPILLVILPCAVILSFIFMFAYNAGWHIGAMLGFFLAAWVLVSIIYTFYQKTRHADNLLAGLKRLSLSFYGMQLAHIGLIMTALGIAIVSTFNHEADVKMAVNDTFSINQYEFVFLGVNDKEGPNYQAKRGHFKVYADDEKVAELFPEKRRYASQMGNIMTEAAIDDSLARDLFIALGEPLDGDAWAVRIQYKPFIRWIWLGAIFMALGAMLAIADKRYR